MADLTLHNILIVALDVKKEATKQKIEDDLTMLEQMKNYQQSKIIIIL